MWQKIDVLELLLHPGKINKFSWANVCLSPLDLEHQIHVSAHRNELF